MNTKSLRLLVATLVTLIDLANGADGVFFSERLENSEAAVENEKLVLRLPLTATNAPQAKGIILADGVPGMKLDQDAGGYFLVNDRSVSQAPFRMYVMFATPPDRERELRLVLNGRVFWDVEPHDLGMPLSHGWYVIPVERDEKPMAVLKAAGAVFRVSDEFLFDLRLTELQRNQRARIRGSLPRTEVEEIRRVVNAMGVQQILKYNLRADREKWQDILKTWPGFYSLEITGDRNRVGVRYAPNRGFQLETREGKWAVVGG